MAKQKIKDYRSNYDSEDFLREHLRIGICFVQEGKCGPPTLKALQVCGKLHKILALM